MSTRVDEVAGAGIAVRFDAKRCIHARACVLGRPAVFRGGVDGQWIFPDEAPAETVAAVAQQCPSGAITYRRVDGGPDEGPPAANVVRLRENGPLAVVADLRLGDEPAQIRATLCRCGASQRKPYCDGSHLTSGCVATGEPAARSSSPLSERSGPLRVRATPNGPLQLEGNVEVVSGTGRTLSRTQACALCRCGASATKPFCDGSHARVGFKVP